MTHAPIHPDPSSRPSVRTRGRAVPTWLVLGLLPAVAVGAVAVTAGPAAGVSRGADDRAAIVHQTNHLRARKGCQALVVAPALVRSAQGHADDMSRKDYFSHTSKDGRRWDQRIVAAGYPKPGGENIAVGFSSASEVMAAWMDSSGHRRNILDCAFRRIGVGYQGAGGYWVQDFGY